MLESIPKLPLTCVLLVDNDSTTNFFNRKLLSRLGFTMQVRVALNEQEAPDELQVQCLAPPAHCPVLTF